MRRFLFNIFAAISLLLFVATAGLWVRSYWVGDGVRLDMPQFGDVTADDAIWLSTGRGGIMFELNRRAVWNGVRQPTKFGPSHSTFAYGETSHPHYPQSDWNLSGPPDIWGKRWGGFEIARFNPQIDFKGSGEGVLYQFNLVTPCYLWVVLLAILPLIHWRRRRGRLTADRLRDALCLKCGYDLRASKNRCPECGTLIPAGTEAKA